MKSLYEHMHYMAELNALYETAIKEFDRRIVLRQYYMEAMPEIIERARTSPTAGVDPYPFDWKFNENERNLWATIRGLAVVFYPEFPVFNRFIDFGNPYLKIGLEADSKKHHSQEDDIFRDSQLRRVGWTLFHLTYEESKRVVPGLGEIRELKVEDRDFDETEMLEELLFTTADGVVSAIEYFYFMDEDARHGRDQRFPQFRVLAEATLQRHCFLPYEVPAI